MNRSRNPNPLPEDEEMDPVGLPYPEQQDPTSPDPPVSPNNEPDIPEDSEFERIVQPVPPNS